METVIHGTSLLSNAFAAAVHGVLRTLIDQLGVTTFNVGISGMAAVGTDLAADFHRGDKTTRTTSVIARCYLGACGLPSAPALLHMHRLSMASFCLLGSNLYAIIILQLVTFAMSFSLQLAWGNIRGTNLAEDTLAWEPSATLQGMCVLEVKA